MLELLRAERHGVDLENWEDRQLAYHRWRGMILGCETPAVLTDYLFDAYRGTGQVAEFLDWLLWEDYPGMFPGDRVEYAYEGPCLPLRAATARIFAAFSASRDFWALAQEIYPDATAARWDRAVANDWEDHTWLHVPNAWLMVELLRLIDDPVSPATHGLRFLGLRHSFTQPAGAVAGITLAQDALAFEIADVDTPMGRGVLVEIGYVYTREHCPDYVLMFPDAALDDAAEAGDIPAHAWARAQAWLFSYGRMMASDL